MPEPKKTAKLAVAKPVAPTELSKEARIRELVGLQYQYMYTAGSLPRHIKSPAHLRMAYELLRPLKLNVATNLRNIFFNPTSQTMELCNDAPLAACQMRRDDYVGTVEWHVNAKNERRSPENFVNFVVEGAVCVAKRRGREDVVGMYTLQQARDAGLANKDNWKKNPVAMLTMRARAIALRNQWSDVLQGVGIAELDQFAAPSAGLRDAELARSMLAPKPAAPPPADVIEAKPDQPPHDELEPDEPPHDELETPPALTPEQAADEELDELFADDEEREPGT